MPTPDELRDKLAALNAENEAAAPVPVEGGGGLVPDAAPAGSPGTNQQLAIQEGAGGTFEDADAMQFAATGEGPVPMANPGQEAAQAYLANTIPAINAAGGGGGGVPTTQTSTTTQEGFNYTPEQAEALSAAGAEAAEARAEQMASVAETGRMTAEIEAEKAAYLNQAADESARLVEDEEASKAALDEELREVDKEIDENIAELKDVTSDPWGGRSGGQVVLGAIAAALGGFAQGFSGGKIPNYALQAINKQIDNHIKGIRAEGSSLQKKRTGKVKKIEDMDKHVIAKTHQLWEHAIQKTQAAGMKLKGDQQKEAADQLVAQMQERQAAATQEGIQALSAKVVNTTMQKRRTGGGGMSLAQKLKMRGQAIKQAKDLKDIYGGPGGEDELKQLNIEAKKRELGMSDAPTRKQMQDYKQAKSLTGIIDKMIAHREEHGAEVVPGVAKSRSMALSKVGGRLIAKALNSGALSDADVSSIEEGMGQLNAIAPSRIWEGEDPVIAQLKTTKELLDSRFADFEKKSGSPDRAKELVDSIRSKK